LRAVRVDRLRQRQLDEDAVDRVVGGEPFEQRQKLGLARFDRQHDQLPGDPHLARGLLFVAGVDERSRIFAHQHDREPGRPTVRRDELAHAITHFATNRRGDGLSIEQRRRQNWTPAKVTTSGWIGNAVEACWPWLSESTKLTWPAPTMFTTRIVPRLPVFVPE
jgi:hypothetical protein